MSVMIPATMSLNYLSSAASVLKDTVSILSSIEGICVSNNMCQIELAKIHIATELICKKIKMKSSFDIARILNEYNYAKIILNSKTLNNKAKEECLSKIIELIQTI